MADKRIRQITVDYGDKIEEKNDQHFVVKRTMIYRIGLVRPLPIGEKGKLVDRTITEITENDTEYTLYIANGAVAQEWMTIPKTWNVIKEYVIE